MSGFVTPSPLGPHDRIELGETSENAGPRPLERTAIEVDRLLPFDAAAGRSAGAPRTPGGTALHRPAPDRTADVRVAAGAPDLARGRHGRPDRVPQGDRQPAGASMRRPRSALARRGPPLVPDPP